MREKRRSVNRYLQFACTVLCACALMLYALRIPTVFALEGGEPEPEPYAAETPAPSETPFAEPTETPGASETPVPKETPQPTDSPEPSVTPEPTATPDPGVSPEPGGTPEPSTSPEPGDTPEPGASPEPSSTPEPAITPAPSVSPEPTATPEPTAAPVPRVVIVAADTEVLCGTPLFDLMTGVYAYDELGGYVPVYLMDDGGFSVAGPGVYSVAYLALHPQTMETFSHTRRITVLEAEPAEDAAPVYDSNERYEILVRYRDEIFTSLMERMKKLSGELEAYIGRVMGDYTEIRLYQQAQIPVEDGSEETVLSREKVAEFEIQNWSDILAVFVAKNLPDVEKPMDLMQLRQVSLDDFESTFWDMQKLDSRVADGALEITLTGRTANEMTDLYVMPQRQVKQLTELLQPEFQQVFASLTGNAMFRKLTVAQEENIRALVTEGLTIERKDIVETAYSLVGKVPYYWGGKYNHVGWNAGWGIPRTETNAAKSAYGATSAYGLDSAGLSRGYSSTRRRTSRLFSQSATAPRISGAARTP